MSLFVSINRTLQSAWSLSQYGLKRVTILTRFHQGFREHLTLSPYRHPVPDPIPQSPSGLLKRHRRGSVLSHGSRGCNWVTGTSYLSLYTRVHFPSETPSPVSWLVNLFEVSPFYNHRLLVPNRLPSFGSAVRFIGRIEERDLRTCITSRIESTSLFLTLKHHSYIPVGDTLPSYILNLSFPWGPFSETKCFRDLNSLLCPLCPSRGLLVSDYLDIDSRSRNSPTRRFLPLNCYWG